MPDAMQELLEVSVGLVPPRTCFAPLRALEFDQFFDYLITQLVIEYERRESVYMVAPEKICFSRSN